MFNQLYILLNSRSGHDQLLRGGTPPACRQFDRLGSRSVVVITPDSDSGDLSSNLSGSFFCADSLTHFRIPFQLTPPFLTLVLNSVVHRLVLGAWSPAQHSGQGPPWSHT